MKLLLIIVSFLIISLQPLFADEANLEKRNTMAFQYQSQQMLYLFLTEDNPSLLEVANDSAKKPDEREFAQFLLQLQALSETKKSFLPGKFHLDQSVLLKLQNIAYENRKYEESLTLSRMLSNSGNSLYREGVSFLALWKLEEAGKALEQVLPDDPLFPYARIALVQKEVMRQNFDAAEKGLKDLVSHPSVNNKNLLDKIHLLLGQVLFEKGLYSEALKEFSGILPDSHFYEDALLGEAWCYAKLEDYMKAIPLFEQAKREILDPTGREALITLGHCLIRSGSLTQAKEYFDKALEAGVSTEKELSNLVENKTLREKYIALLKGDIEAEDVQEQRYLSYLRKDSNIDKLLSEIRYLHTLLAGFLRAKNKIADNEAYFDNIDKGLKEVIGSVESQISDIRSVLLKADIILDPEMAKTSNKKQYKKGQELIENYLANMFGSWKYYIEREIPSETKYVAQQILQEIFKDEELRCFDDPIICYIAGFLAYSKGTTDKSQVRSIVLLLDSIVGDMAKARKGEKIYFEGLLPGIRGNVNNKINALNKTVIKIKKIREATDFNIKEIEKVLDTADSILELYIVQGFVNARYDIEDFKSRVASGISSIQNFKTKDAGLHTSN